MRICAVVVAGATFATACGTNTYKIRDGELMRLAQLAPDARGQHVRIAQELHDTDVGPEEPVRADTAIIIFPEPTVYGPERRRYYTYGGGGSGGDWSGGVRSGGPPRNSGGIKGGGSGGGSSGGGSGGNGKAEAIAILAAAAVIVVAAAAIEGSRFDGYADVHPMQPVHLFGKDGGYTVLPLAWIDPQTAAWADHALIKTTEGPVGMLERAPLDRVGPTYALMGGVGTYKSVDGATDRGVATAIQLGYFPDQKLGLVGTLFFGWRDNTTAKTIFETRDTLELHAYPVQAGILHLGLYGGGGFAYRVEDYGNVVGAGNGASMALVGGALVQLDINTRVAIQGRFGTTYAHDEQMPDAMVGLAVY